MKNAADAAGAVVKAGIDRDIVTGTLNKLNKGIGIKKSGTSAQAAVSDTYHLSRSILSAAYEGKGTLIDSSR
ncbi:MAG: hypothetical protein LBU06_12305 [Desulfovibrio sp.]|jgi:hypothetical protein|nr:hypothetical protein [Desulfovibrio sp.]